MSSRKTHTRSQLSVVYEGCFWQARTEGYQGAIAPNQRVYVLRREGNTLIVLPESLFQR